MTPSPQQAASAEAARFNAQQAASLANIALPEVSSTLASVFSDLETARGGGIPASVKARFDPIISQTNQDYKSAGQGTSAYIKESAKTGNVYAPNAVSDSLLAAGQTLEASRRTTQRDLAYQESVAGLDEYNQLISLMAGGSGAALNLAGGFSGAQAQAIGGLSNKSPGQGALAGGLSGAAAGSSINFPYGTIIGGVLGAAGGYFGSQ